MKNILKNILRSIFLFLLGNTLAFMLWGFCGLFTNILMGVCNALDLWWLYRLVGFIFYILVLNSTFYALYRSQKRYVNTLPRDKCISAKDDFILFVKQEGIVVLIVYTVVVSLQIFVFRFIKGYFEAFFAFPAMLASFKNNWVNLAVCVLAFALGYGGLTVFIRRKIRKRRYNYLFENKVGETAKK